MSKFYNFVDRKNETDLFISGEIIRNDDKEFYEWYGQDFTAPQDFVDQLNACGGKPINIYIDSYGGDVQVASYIYSALKEYTGKKTVKIPSIAASAASVIAMAGDTILMAKTAVIVIHDPLTFISGNASDLEKGIEVLNTIKESILNAYTSKSNLPKEKIAELMTAETWLDYNTALEYGFIDGEINSNNDLPEEIINGFKNQKMVVYNRFKDDMKEKFTAYQKAQEEKRAKEREAIKQKNINIYKAIMLNKTR